MCLSVSRVALNYFFSASDLCLYSISNFSFSNFSFCSDLTTSNFSFLIISFFSSIFSILYKYRSFADWAILFLSSFFISDPFSFF